jgi:hypothetical protein
MVLQRISAVQLNMTPKISLLKLTVAIPHTISEEIVITIIFSDYDV